MENNNYYSSLSQEDKDLLKNFREENISEWERLHDNLKPFHLNKNEIIETLNLAKKKLELQTF